VCVVLFYDPILGNHFGPNERAKGARTHELPSQMSEPAPKRQLKFTVGRAASGGALAPQLPLAKSATFHTDFFWWFKYGIKVFISPREDRENTPKKTLH